MPVEQTENKLLTTVTREVLIQTTNAGTGQDYQHPTKYNYNNPITSVYHYNNSNAYLKFATKDGVIGV